MRIALNLEQLQAVISQRSFEEKLALVRMLETQTFSERFKRLLAQVRTDELTFDDITAEVEAVRRARYAAKKRHLLDLNVSGQADYLVTDDGDLRALNPFHGTQIITYRAFEDLLHKLR